MSTETLKYEVNIKEVSSGIKVWVTYGSRYIGDAVTDNRHHAVRIAAGMIVTDLPEESFVAGKAS